MCVHIFEICNGWDNKFPIFVTVGKFSVSSHKMWMTCWLIESRSSDAMCLENVIDWKEIENALNLYWYKTSSSEIISDMKWTSSVVRICESFSLCVMCKNMCVT